MYFQVGNYPWSCLWLPVFHNNYNCYCGMSDKKQMVKEDRSQERYVKKKCRHIKRTIVPLLKNKKLLFFWKLLLIGWIQNNGTEKPKNDRSATLFLRYNQVQTWLELIFSCFFSTLYIGAICLAKTENITWILQNFHKWLV